MKRALAAVLVAGVLSGGGPRAADGQTLEPSLTLVEQSAVTEPEGQFELRVRITDAPPDATLEVRVHDRVRTRSEFARSIEGEGLRRELTTSRPGLVADLGLDAAGTAPVRVLLRDTGSDPARLRITAAGVYPVELVLADGQGDTLDDLVTHLVRLPDTGDTSPPLAVAVVLPLHAQPALQADGTTVLANADRARVAANVAALGDQPRVPATVLPTPETVDALAAGLDPGDDGILARLRAALGGRQLLAAPYVDVDLNAWVAAGLDAELGAQLTRGADVVTDQLGRPDGRTWVASGPLTDAALARLRAQGVDQVVVREEDLEPIDEHRFPVTLAQAFELGADPDHRARAVMADTVLSAHVNASADPVLDAHRLLADLATIYFDAPPQPRGTVVAIPERAAPSRLFLDALLSGLGDGRILRATTVDDLFSLVPTATSRGQVSALPSDPRVADPLVRTFTPTSPVGLGGLPAAITGARSQLASYVSMIGRDNPRSDPFEQRILVAGAASLSPAARTDYLDAVVDGIHTEVARVVLPKPQTITLTARNGNVPLSLRNDADYPFVVVVRLESDKLEFPENPGGTLTIELAGQSTTRVEVPVRTRTSGDTSVEISVSAPDGGIEVARSRFTVRSTAVSGVGVVISIGAGVFLLVWWARNFHTTRRSRRLVGSD